MYEIRLKDVKNGEIFSFFGRKLAEVRITLKNPVRRGRGILYVTEALHRRIPNDEPGYVMAVDAADGAYEIRKLRDNYQVRKFFEWVLEDGMADIDNRHPLFSHVLEILRTAMANDVDLMEVYDAVAARWTDLKLAKKVAARIPPKPKPTGAAVGHFEDREIFPDPAISPPTI